MVLIDVVDELYVGVTVVPSAKDSIYYNNLSRLS